MGRNSLLFIIRFTAMQSENPRYEKTALTGPFYDCLLCNGGCPRFLALSCLRQPRSMDHEN